MTDREWPNYPKLASAKLAKYRYAARKGLRLLSLDERRAYGDAVEQAILALQRSEANTGLPAVTPKVHCASGTAHNTGEAIHKALREQQATALRNCPSTERRRRKPETWRSMYAEAMKEKRERQSHERETRRHQQPRASAKAGDKRKPALLARYSDSLPGATSRRDLALAPRPDRRSHV